MFDAAIECLREHISIKREYKLNLEELPSFELAVIVLEAAARLSSAKTYEDKLDAHDDLVSVIAALPDAPKEGKK